MFYIPPHVRDEAIEAMRVVLVGKDASQGPEVPACPERSGSFASCEHLSPGHLGAAFDAAVEIVLKQMGLAR